MKRLLLGFGLSLLAVGVLTRVGNANPGTHFNFSSFDIPAAVTLSVNGINNLGTISGYFVDAAGNTKSWTRTPNGKVTVFVDPLNTTSPSFTRDGQINDQGTVVGQFFNSQTAQYSGYFYNNGHFAAYDVPNEPAGTTTGLFGINDLGQQICGFVLPPPFTVVQAFNSTFGHVAIYSVNGSSSSYCIAENNLGLSVGAYFDSAGNIRGFLRTPNGHITNIDYPGASSTPAVSPCSSGLTSGTQPNGINDLGVVSGHFWDTSNNEHGFVRLPNGTLIPIDVPGAYQTGGGGINDFGVMAGHYYDNSCNDHGFIVNTVGGH